MKKVKLISYLLAFVLVADLTYSFLQYYNTPLDGDMAGGIVPAKHVQKIFDDPFGFSAIATQTNHANPNRYFAHLFFKEYFRSIPFLYQKITSPIKSIYLATASAKLLIHIGLLYFLASLISQTTSLKSKQFLLAAILITPLFQAYGYSRSLGIIDHSITYTFFYALPMLWLLLFFFLYYRTFFQTKKSHYISKFLMSILILILPFSGALIPPILIISSFLFLILQTFKKKYFKPPKASLYFIVPLLSLCIYSLYLGTYNSSFENLSISILERYKRLPIGIFSYLTQMLGYPLLILTIGINSFIIKKHYKTKEAKAILFALKWIGLFSLVYILLLPLGGYRIYRPNIIRFDTMIPITIALCYVFGKSSLFLLQNIRAKKNLYILSMIAFFTIISFADISTLNEANCEKEALKTIAISTNKLVVLTNNCTIVSWNIVLNKESTCLNSKLLHFWNITNEEKLYVQK